MQARPEEAMMNRRMFQMASCVTPVAFFIYISVDVGLPTAYAAENLRVGKSIGVSFTYVPLDVGISQDIFQKQGIDIEVYNFGGAARQMQAMVSDSVDIGLGCGRGYKDTVDVAQSTPH